MSRCKLYTVKYKLKQNFSLIGRAVFYSKINLDDSILLFFIEEELILLPDSGGYDLEFCKFVAKCELKMFYDFIKTL